MSDELHVSESAGAYVLGALTAEDAQAVESHAASCDACRKEILELKRVVGVLPLASPSVEPSTDLKARILAASRGEDRAETILRRAVVKAARNEPKRDFWHRPLPAWAGIAGWMGLAAACAVAGMYIGVADEHHRMTLALQTPAAPRALGRVVNAELAAAPYQVHTVSGDQVEKAQIENAAAVIGESQVWDLSVSKTGPRIPCKVIQLPRVAHAMLVSSMPPPKAGMVYRVWLVRRGKVHMGAVVAAGPKKMTIIPMRVQSGDVIAFSEEPKGGSALPGPFMMEQTL